MAAKRNTAAKTAVVKCKTQAKTSKKPVKGTTRSVQKVPAKQVTKRSTQKGTSVAVTSDLFRGAKAVEITQNLISVTHEASRSRKGSFEQTERRRYISQTPKTRAAVNAALDEASRTGKVKKIRVEFKK